MPQLVTLGETMAAFAPGAYGPLRYVRDYEIHTAGAESNLAIGISKLGCSAGWISKLGEDEFGHYVLNSIRAEGVTVDKVIFDPDHRTGVMFKETNLTGESKVFYYRENSAASHLSKEDINEDYIAQAEILHLTGITPILSPSCLDAVRQAMSFAKKHGVLISFDPNIRKKLWKGHDYSDLIKDITLQSDIVLLGLDEADAMFHTKDENQIFDILFSQGQASYIAIKNGSKGAMVADQKTRTVIPPHPCKCVEPIGAGDAFNAGFLTGILTKCDTILCGKMGAIAGALATQTPGDIEGYPSKQQMEQILSNSETIYR